MDAHKLPSGNYRTQLIVGYTMVDGKKKRITQSFTAPTRWESLKMAEDYLNGIDNRQKDNITIKEAMQEYVRCRSNMLEETTICNYNEIIRNKLQSIMDVRLKNLTPLMIQQAINDDSRLLSAKSVRNAYGLLTSVLRMFDIDINLHSIRLPKNRKKEKELPSFEAVYSVVKGTSVELPVLLAAWQSLRMGEILGLQFRDLDTKSCILHVQRTMIKTEEGMKLRDGCKTEKSDRKLVLPPYLVQMITQIKHNKDTDFIFPLSRKALYSRFKRIIQKADIDMTFHDLRHLNASIMLMLNIPDKYACERGGWSTDYVLKSVYQQTFSSERRKVDAIVDNYFNDIIIQTNSNP